MPDEAAELVLTGLNTDELEALAEGMLAIPQQQRLDELLHRNYERRLAPEELTELDRLVKRVDQLMLLKAKAKYTLQLQGAAKL